jgi:hypothetical protein
VGVAITDVMTGVLSAGAVCAVFSQRGRLLPVSTKFQLTLRNRCAALQHRSSCGPSGLGQHIQSSLLETQVFSLANIAANWLTAGQEAQRVGNAHPSIVPYQTFKAADCELAVGAGNNKQARTVTAPRKVCLLKVCLVRSPLPRPRPPCPARRPAFQLERCTRGEQG